jgi:CelD/BcsL family acetyltransferase involved in cellulose biosynthesis
VADGWDELADRVGALPWIRRGWVEAWLRAFGGRPEIYVASDHEGFTGVLPLIRRRNELLSPTNWHTPAFGPVVRKASAMNELFGAVLGKRPRRLDLRFLPKESGAVESVVDEAQRAGYRVIAREAIRSPYISLEGSWEGLEKRLARKLRNDLRRCQRRLEEKGNVSVEISTGEKRLESLLDEGFGIEGSGWKDEKGTAVDSTATTERFYRDVARWAQGQGWLRLAFLRLDGRPIAFDFVLEVENVLYDVKGGYDRELARHSPGKVLLRELLTRAFARRISSFEFLGESEPYKLAWTRMTRERWIVQAFSRSPLGMAEWAAFQYGRPLTKKILSVAR